MTSRALLVAVVALAAAACSGGAGDREAPATVAPTTARAEPSAHARGRDPCPQLPERCPALTEWVTRVLERAGYEIVGDTGSAVIAAGPRPESFYAWATVVDGGARTERKRWPSLGRVAGIPLYGDEERTWWLASGVVVWIEAGPFADSALPRGRRLTRLVRASQLIPAPVTGGRG